MDVLSLIYCKAKFRLFFDFFFVFFVHKNIREFRDIVFLVPVGFYFYEIFQTYNVHRHNLVRLIN